MNFFFYEIINKLHALQSVLLCSQPQLTLVTLTRCGYEVEARWRVGAMQKGGMGEQGGPIAKPIIACLCCQRDRCASAWISVDWCRGSEGV